jgi:phage gpG-like protein
MVSVKVRVKSWKGREITYALEQEMHKRLNLIGEKVASYARRNMSTSTRANGASLAGEFPHADTSRLRGSVTHETENRGGGDIVALVGSNVEYAPHLELGTNEMEPRPFLMRSIEDLKPEIVAIISRPFRGGGKGSK